MGSAWFFIVVSLLHVVGAVIVKLGDPATTFKLYHTIVGGVSYDAWGLVYSGWPGLLLVIVELMLVSGAVAATLLKRPALLRWRRAGHAVLVGWAALWMLDLMRLAAVDGLLASYAQAALVAWLFGCTAYRAAAGWSPGPRRSSSGHGEPAGVGRGDGDPAAPQGNGAAGGLRWRAVATLPRLQRLRAATNAARSRTARGLHCVADFTRRQAERVAPPGGR